MLRTLMIGRTSLSSRLAVTELAYMNSTPAFQSEVPDDFLAYSKWAEQHGSWLQRTYAILSWIAFSPAAEARWGKGEQPQVLARFLRMLPRDIAFSLHGLKPNGDTFQTIIGHSALLLRDIEVSALRMMSYYATL